jgi:hypothetical protein
MKKGVVILVISLLLININFVSSIDLESYSCTAQWEIQGYNYACGDSQVVGYQADCCEITNDIIPYCLINDVFDWSLCLSGLTGGEGNFDYGNGEVSQYCDSNNVQIDYIEDNEVLDYVNEDCTELGDLSIFYCNTENQTANPCFRCDIIDLDDPNELEGCIGWRIGDTRHCPGYPNTGRCATAIQTYQGHGIWSSCSYNWNINTQEICDNSRDDDCDWQIDEGCVGACLGSQEFCTNNEDGCCPGLTCIGDVNKLCLTCRNEGETCWNDGDCCNRPCDGVNNQGDSICGCPEGFIWNPNLGCHFPTQQCYSSPCPIRISTNFIQWLGNPGCFKNFLGIENSDPPYRTACCPYNPGEGYETVYDFNFDGSEIIVS